VAGVVDMRRERDWTWQRTLTRLKETASCMRRTALKIALATGSVRPPRSERQKRYRSTWYLYQLTARQNPRAKILNIASSSQANLTLAIYRTELLGKD